MRYFNLLAALSILASANSYEANCKSCHTMEQQLNIFMHRYTLKYSSPKRIKQALFTYMKNPQATNSIMPMGFLNRWGVKKPSSLSDQELQEAIEEYYRLYNLQKVWK
ncbi:MAG: hypothetical protein JXQ76_13485 [Campylobacterales bacterium]|nr:hypothetical protein [Campylobacterales bacterium]